MTWIVKRDGVYRYLTDRPSHVGVWSPELRDARRFKTRSAAEVVVRTGGGALSSWPMRVVRLVSTRAAICAWLRSLEGLCDPKELAKEIEEMK